jgi:uncharacterized damage-inducible protein DinB
MPHTRVERLMADYLDGPVQLRGVVTDLNQQQLQARPVRGKWSTLEVVCHLVDSEQAWCYRMKRVIAEQNPLLIGYDESRFAAALRYHERKLEEELALLEGMRRQLARILQGLAESAWTRTCIHSERGLLTLEEMLQAEVEHIPHHIRHINEKRKTLGLPVVELRSSSI